MRNYKIFLTSLAALLAFAGCSPKQGTLTVFAASSLTDVFNEIADTLRQRQPALRIDLNFAGSQALALQIEQGAAADVFASADDRWMNAVKDSGLVAVNPMTFAHNQLVVIFPRANPGRIAQLQDLARADLKIVLAADAVPAGRYARTAFSNLAHHDGFSADFSEKVLANVVSNEENVKGVVTKVQLAEADAGVAYRTDLNPTVTATVSYLEFPDATAPLASYPIAVLKHGATSPAATAFVELVMSQTGQKILARNGFIVSPGKP